MRNKLRVPVRKEQRDVKSVYRCYKKSKSTKLVEYIGTYLDTYVNIVGAFGCSDDSYELILYRQSLGGVGKQNERDINCDVSLYNETQIPIVMGNEGVSSVQNVMYSVDVKLVEHYSDNEASLVSLM